jgi:hypothetical protein
LASAERWKSRWRTATAIVALTWAQFVIATLPFDRWRNRLGLAGETAAVDQPLAKRLAAHVDWAARLLPFDTKCLPRAMALSWILRRERLAHAVVFAARPAGLRGSEEDLHAWVEVAGETVLGDLPGPWVETLRLGN